MSLPEEKARVTQALAVLLTRALLTREEVVLSVTGDDGATRVYRVHAEELREPGGELQQELPLAVSPTMEDFISSLARTAELASEVGRQRPEYRSVAATGNVLASLVEDFRELASATKEAHRGSSH